jgi:thioredoxin reductase (NADPH)
MGSDVHSGLAAGLGADLTADGCIKVDHHQRTTVPGLYAAGDAVLGLDQISHAMDEAGVAATAVRNSLAEQQPLLRQPFSSAAL